jgi:hypothetical protein
MLTLRVYAHAMGEEEADLSFVDFNAAGVRNLPATRALDEEGVARVAFRHRGLNHTTETKTPPH